jgi:hypothetical protein
MVMSLFEILQPVADAAFGRYKTTPFEELSEEDQTVILIWSLTGEVNNGGFDQYYFNSSGDFATETVSALSRIGAIRTAQLLVQANGLFPTQPPPKNREQRIAELDRFTDRAAAIWRALETDFYRDPDKIEKRLVEYLVRRGILPQDVEADG